MNESAPKRKPKRRKRKTLNGELGYSEKVAAHRLGVSYITLFRRRKEGLIRFYRIGGRVIYDDACLAEFKQNCLVA